VPTTSVFKHDCERCKRTWYDETEETKTKLNLELRTEEGEILRCHFDVLCSGCVKTVTTNIKSLLRIMRKASPNKSEAKKEESNGSPPPLPTNGLVAAGERTPGVGAPRPALSAHAKRP
jgi:hypothetical protein